MIHDIVEKISQPEYFVPVLVVLALIFLALGWHADRTSE